MTSASNLTMEYLIDMPHVKQIIPESNTLYLRFFPLRLQLAFALLFHQRHRPQLAEMTIGSSLDYDVPFAAKYFFGNLQDLLEKRLIFGILKCSAFGR